MDILSVAILRVCWLIVVFEGGSLAAGKESDVQKITIEVGPGQNAIRDEDLIFYCNRTSAEKETGGTIVWTSLKPYKAENERYKVLDVASAHRLVDNGTGAISYYYKLPHTPGPNDAGNYSCILRGATENKTLCEFFVQTAPVIGARNYRRVKDKDPKYMYRGQSFFLQYGDNLDIPCEYFAYPKTINVTWYKIDHTEDVEVLGQDLTKGLVPALNFGPLVIENGTTLLLRNVTSKERGFYMCRAEKDGYMFQIYYLVRTRSKLAPLYPVIGLLLQAILIALIVILCEWRRRKNDPDDDDDVKHSARANVANASEPSSSLQVGGGTVKQRVNVSGGKSAM